MNITTNFLDKNKYSRPGTEKEIKQLKLLGIM